MQLKKCEKVRKTRQRWWL